MKNLLILTFAIIMLSGCYYDNLEELHPGEGPCDTTGTISFSADIMPILNRSCGTNDAGCHVDQSASSGYGLATYDDIILTIDDSGNFLESIKHDPALASTSWMPKNSTKLDNCSIYKIEAWLNGGRLNN